MPAYTSSTSNHQPNDKSADFLPELNQEDIANTSCELRLRLREAGYTPVPVTGVDNHLPGNSKAGKAVR